MSKRSETEPTQQDPGLRVLVAGATGYLGKYVVRELKRRGYWVRVLVRSRERFETLGIEADEVFVGELTRRQSLEGVCDGVDTVFSCAGITRQHDGLTWKDVDYQGNLHLLEKARAAGIGRFVYVSVFGAERTRHLDIVAAHEDFVDALRDSGLDWQVLRPTGYFSDLASFLDMARGGRVYLFGSGEQRVNPIHGADLAAVCADVIGGDRTDREIDVGGPEIFTWRQVGEMALGALAKPSRMTSIPLWLADLLVLLLRPFGRHRSELLRFFVSSGRADCVAPRYGTHTLGRHFEELAADGRQS